MIDGRRGRRADSDPKKSDSPIQRRASIGRRLVHLGVTADAITGIGVVLAGATAVMIGLGHLYVGIGLLIVGGLMDTLDGAVAKAAGTSSARGAFVDSVSDRVADALIFGGVAWYIADTHSPRTALLPLAVLAMSSIVSYERAKAESLGFRAHGGLMERAERLILLGLALLLHVIIVPLLWVLLSLTTLTAIGRFVRVWRQAPITEHQQRVAARRDSRLAMRQNRASAARRGRRELEPLGLRVRAMLRSESERRTRRPSHRTGRVRASRTLGRRSDNNA